MSEYDDICNDVAEQVARDIEREIREKSLYLPILDLSNIGITEQYEKVHEEFKEFHFSTYYSLGELEEALDVIQVIYGYIKKQYTKEQIKTALDKHMQKAQNRYKVVGKLMICEVDT